MKITPAVLEKVLIVIVSCLSLPSGAQEKSIFLPAGGNAWLSGGTDKLTQEGIVGWNDTNTACTFFVHVSSGELNVALLLRSLSSSHIRVMVQPLEITSEDLPKGEKEKKQADYQWMKKIVENIPISIKEVAVLPGQTLVQAGTWSISKEGYIVIGVKGLSKDGENYGDLSGLELGGTAVLGETSFVPNNEDNYFYWGRRGPSVHLRFDLGGRTDIEWFYSEITVPEGNDKIGSYYMANGFSDGYFGFQVNSETERRVLFSVWSPFKTDDPKSIPEGDRIRLIKKGETVDTGEFGNEGSGGQSYLRFPWKAGGTYGFLLHAQPEGNEATVYTAWFMAPEIGQWQLIASFRRPKKATYLTGLYSFLENFIPETGARTRMARFGNQWVRDKDGRWLELTQAKFTGDNTARKNYRKDYSGGVNGNTFFLRNCGFFNDYTKLDQLFDRPATGTPPKIDMSSLP